MMVVQSVAYLAEHLVANWVVMLVALSAELLEKKLVDQMVS